MDRFGQKEIKKKRPIKTPGMIGYLIKFAIL